MIKISSELKAKLAPRNELIKRRLPNICGINFTRIHYKVSVNEIVQIF